MAHTWDGESHEDRQPGEYAIDYTRTSAERHDDARTAGNGAAESHEVRSHGRPDGQTPGILSTLEDGQLQLYVFDVARGERAKLTNADWRAARCVVVSGWKKKRLALAVHGTCAAHARPLEPVAAEQA